MEIIDPKQLANNFLLVELFKHENVRYRPIVVNLCSQQDQNKGGKIIAVLTRFLNSEFRSINGEIFHAYKLNVDKLKQSWITKEQTNLNIKVNIFKDIFFCKNIQNGDDQDITLMDIQGILNKNLSHNIFPIQSRFLMISNGIGEFELQYLKTSIDYGKFIASLNLEPPNYLLRKTAFMITDEKADTFGYGPEGGNKYFNYILKNKKTIEEAVSVTNICIIFSDYEIDSEFMSFFIEYLKFFEERPAYSDKHELFMLLFERTELFLHDPKVEKKLNSIDNTCVERYVGTSHKINEHNISLDNYKNCKPETSGESNYLSNNLEKENDEETDNESENEDKEEEKFRNSVSPTENIKNDKIFVKSHIFVNLKKRRIHETLEKNFGKKPTIKAVINKKKEKFQFDNSTRSTKNYLRAVKQGLCYFEKKFTEHALVHIMSYLSNNDKLNLIAASELIASIIRNSRPILNKFVLMVDRSNFESIFRCAKLNKVNLLCASFNLEGFKKMKELKMFLNKFKHSIECLEVRNLEANSFAEFYEIFANYSNLKSLTLEKCRINCVGKEAMPQLASLEILSFNKCGDSVFSVFRNQKNILQFTVRNDDWTWNGFPHEIFNQILRNSKNLKHIVLIGSGTGSYFDSDEFPYNITKLTTSMITFHWYVGIKTQRTTFLKSQLGHLQDLTIDKLPFDFDGGRVLKFIFEKMNLQFFHYGKIPLILEGKKQQVEEFEATEIQIQSSFEMFRQFSDIKRFRLILSETDIASDEIEKVINPQTRLFDNLKEFEVIDNSKYRGTLGVFLGLLKNLRNIRKISIISQDRNINVLLEECLPYMSHVSEIYLTSKVKRSFERFQIIKSFAPNLNKISVAAQYAEEVIEIFGKFLNVCKINGNE